MEEIVYYWIDTPTLWQVIYEDELYYYIKPINRITNNIDRWIKRDKI
jgi:hypothetical protein